MSVIELIIHLSALASIGTLPLLVFARGRASGGWWATAWPFFVAPFGVLASVAGLLPLLWDPHTGFGVGLRCLGLMASLGGIILIGWTGLTHRGRPNLWHQQDSAPRSLVTTGPYAHVRHPFYSAFLLILSGAFVGFPTLVGLICLGYAGLALTITAAREEHTFLASHMALAYIDYTRRAGRFLPRLRLDGEGKTA
jgi:protein-S-isoprenylcysteine O-methyltransferase Ste14